MQPLVRWSLHTETARERRTIENGRDSVVRCCSWGRGRHQRAGLLVRSRRARRPGLVIAAPLGRSRSAWPWKAVGPCRPRTAGPRRDRLGVARREGSGRAARGGLREWACGSFRASGFG